MCKMCKKNVEYIKKQYIILHNENTHFTQTIFFQPKNTQSNKSQKWKFRERKISN